MEPPPQLCFVSPLLASNASPRQRRDSSISIHLARGHRYAIHEARRRRRRPVIALVTQAGKKGQREMRVWRAATLCHWWRPRRVHDARFGWNARKNINEWNVRYSIPRVFQKERRDVSCVASCHLPGRRMKGDGMRRAPGLGCT